MRMYWTYRILYVKKRKGYVQLYMPSLGAQAALPKFSRVEFDH